MDEENHSIEKNKTRELATLPKGQKAIGVKWEYKIKRGVCLWLNEWDVDMNIK